MGRRGYPCSADGERDRTGSVGGGLVSPSPGLAQILHARPTSPGVK